MSSVIEKSKELRLKMSLTVRAISTCAPSPMRRLSPSSVALDRFVSVTPSGATLVSTPSTSSRSTRSGSSIAMVRVMVSLLPSGWVTVSV